MLDQLQQSLQNLWNKDRSQMIYEPLDKTQVDLTSDYVQLEHERHYIHLYLVEMFLKKQVQYLQTWFPAVHAVVRFDFEGSSVDVPNIADSTRIGAKQVGQGDVIARNFELTPLIPFNSGTINVQAGLVAVQGQNYLSVFIKTLSDFAGLLAVPQFSAVLGVAGPLASGLQSLLASGGLHLALQDTFGTANHGGYYITIRATENQVDTKSLRVEKNQLRIKHDGDKTKPFDLYDYMLFRMEITDQRTDWDQLTKIQEPMRKAHQALNNMDAQGAEAYRRQAIIAAHEAAELTRADRTRVKLKINKDFEELKKDLGYSNLVGGAEYSLTKSMKRAIPVEDALKRTDPSFLELLGQ